MFACLSPSDVKTAEVFVHPVFKLLNLCSSRRDVCDEILNTLLKVLLNHDDVHAPTFPSPRPKQAMLYVICACQTITSMRHMVLIVEACITNHFQWQKQVATRPGEHFVFRYSHTGQELVWLLVWSSFPSYWAHNVLAVCFCCFRQPDGCWLGAGAGVPQCFQQFGEEVHWYVCWRGSCALSVRRSAATTAPVYQPTARAELRELRPVLVLSDTDKVCS